MYDHYPDRKAKAKNIKHLLKVKIHTVRFTASGIGGSIAALPGVKYGPLFYRHMETGINQAPET